MSKYSALLYTRNPWMGSKGQNIFFSEEGHVAYQKERSVEHYAKKMFDPMHTPYVLGWVKRSKIEIELSALIGFGYDLSDAQVGIRCWRNGIYILWLTHGFRLAIQPKGVLFKKKFRNLSECQMVWIQIRTDILSFPIWVQNFAKVISRRQNLPLARKKIIKSAVFAMIKTCLL